jgi:hypothetical protein
MAETCRSVNGLLPKTLSGNRPVVEKSCKTMSEAGWDLSPDVQEKNTVLVEIMAA